MSKRHPCPDCDKTFKRSDNLLDHMNLHTGEKPYRCEECDIGFPYRSSLYNHNKSKHSDDTSDEADSNHSCDQCRKTYKTAAGLETHQTQKHTLKTCDVCRKSYKGTIRFDRHLEDNCQPAQTFDVIQCNNCYEAFPNRSEYKSHWHANHGPRAVKRLIEESDDTDEEPVKRAQIINPFQQVIRQAVQQIQTSDEFKQVLKQAIQESIQDLVLEAVQEQVQVSVREVMQDMTSNADPCGMTQ